MAPLIFVSGRTLTFGPTQSKLQACGELGSEVDAILGAIMNITKPLGSDEIESSEVEVRRNTRELARGQAEGDDVKTPADDLAALLRRMSDASTREIENLINELQAVRKQLQNAGNRIQRDIEEYAALSQQVMQLTDIISDSVKKLPRGAH
jgi:ElaB/YqjD/DUF883 family membrane-anchored ribosome-binding protein